MTKVVFVSDCHCGGSKLSLGIRKRIWLDTIPLQYMNYIVSISTTGIDNIELVFLWYRTFHRFNIIVGNHDFSMLYSKTS